MKPGSQGAKKGKVPDKPAPYRGSHEHRRFKVKKHGGRRAGNSAGISHPRAFNGYDVWRESLKRYSFDQEYIKRLEAVRKKLHENVCRVCVDHGYDERCYTLDPAGCVLNRMLPEIVEVISKIDSKYVQDYLDGIRTRVCASCPNQDQNGRCEVREKADCGLNAYLALVIDAVESVVRGGESDQRNVS